MKMPPRLHGLGILILLACLGLAPAAWGWAHQGHILITRLAALRILEDPHAPEGLKNFLQAHLKTDREACQRLATQETVGREAEDYLAGLDGACTWPDRIQDTPEGQNTKLQPYAAPESKMHFFDLEVFCPDPNYKNDLSNTPKLADLPRDPQDPRYARAGFVPFRVEESYRELRRAFGYPPTNPPTPIHDRDALRWAGYLAHYLADCHQPQHSTEDYKSLSYLAGHVAGVTATRQKLPSGVEITVYKSDSRDINPHGDLEYQLFANAQEPRKTLREQFWKELNNALADLDNARLPLLKMPPPPSTAPAFTASASTAPASDADLFAWSFGLLEQGHAYLPLIGQASQAAYAQGRFDPQAFFTYEAEVQGEKMTVLRMMARQNARAVLAIEQAYRRAWAQAKGP